MTNQIIDARIVMKSYRIEEMVSPFLQACESVMKDCAIEARAAYDANKSISEIRREIFKIKHPRARSHFGFHSEFVNFEPPGYRQAKGFLDMARASDEVEISHTDLSFLQSFKPGNANAHFLYLKASRKTTEEFLSDKRKELEEVIATKAKEAAEMEEERILNDEIDAAREDIASSYDKHSEPIAPLAWVAIVVMIACAVLFIASK